MIKKYNEKYPWIKKKLTQKKKILRKICKKS